MATSDSHNPSPSERARQKKADDLQAKLGKRNLLLALEKKKRCNARAQLIVEEFLETARDPDHFLDKLPFISQSHYDDIVEERSIERHCGYPLCPGLLTNVPSKQYHICRTNNTVYDITERKKFCTTPCFRASNYIRAQLLTSPLWLRDAETMPEFRLMAEWSAPDEPQTKPAPSRCTESIRSDADESDELQQQMQNIKLETAS